MSNACFRLQPPSNEPVLTYAPGTPERKAIAGKIEELRQGHVEIPLIIGGKAVRTGRTAPLVIPHDHRHFLGIFHNAGLEQIEMAVTAARRAAAGWAEMPWEARVAVFRRAAELIAGPYRMLINAATVLGQSKNLLQAEIDAACEMIDFLRFNTYFSQRILSEQPLSGEAEWNRIEYRPLEGFVYAVSPFNFTAIGGNLASAPAMLGNTVLWKPASNAVYSAYFLMQIFQEAGLPDGVINFIPGSGSEVGLQPLESPELAGVHFTGSTAVFKRIWKTVGRNLDQYRTYPRIVGETGGKDFIFLHRSADLEAAVAAAVRGAFEYQGQKCSAASRLYVPQSLWETFRKRLIDALALVRTGSPEDFSNFVNAVIDSRAYHKIVDYIEQARQDEAAEIIAGGTYDDRVGYFITPTVIVAHKPDYRTMQEEIFGPLLTIYVYADDQYEETLHLCDRTSPYALTGAIFANERQAITKAGEILRHAAGNFYINDKPTGAVVGRQPFGGGRASGTNDKAGSVLNLYRWLSPRTIKENFLPPKDFRYPFMGND